MTDYRGDFSRPDKNGEYTYNKLQGNIDCYSNSPNNVTSNTPTIIHSYGARIDEVWYDSQKEALNRDGTFLFPARMSNPIDVFENVYREVWNKSNNTENIILTGHSAGGPTALKALATMYKEGNISGSPPLVVTLDGSFLACKLTPEEIEILADNKVPIIAYYQLDEQTSYYKMLGENGVNIALYRDKDCHDHATPCTNFFENKKGLYDFASGKGTLISGNNGYNVSIWSGGNEVYTNAGNYNNISEVNTLDKVYNFFDMDIDTYTNKIQQLKSLNVGSLSNLTFAINNRELDKNLRNVIANIGSTSYATNSSGSNISSEGSTLTLSKVANLTKSYFSTTTDLLLNIANEMKEFTKISPVISSMEKNMEEEAIQLNNQSKIELSPLASTAILNNNVGTRKEEQVTISNQISDTIKTKPIDNSMKTETKQETEKEVVKAETKPSQQSNQNSIQYSKPNQELQSNTQEQFPEYSEVYSDETKIVYNYNDKYRIIVHKDGDKVTGIEHYYNFENANNANNALESLKLEYSSNQNVEKIIQKGQYVKVLFNEKTYGNLTIADIRNKYSGLNEIIKL